MIYLLPAILVLPYFFWLLRIYRGLQKIEPFIVAKQPETFVSVIVACRDEQEHLPVLLNKIALQDYSTELFEVIIVDDNSADRTYEIASDFKNSGNIKVIHNKGIGKKQAIRSGIDASSGNLIITTDADCKMGKSWIRTIAAFFEKYHPDMIICPVKIEAGPGFFGRFQELEFLSLQGITAGSLLSGEGIMCNGANLSFTRKVYVKHSGNLHDEIASGDDVFFLHSLKHETGSKLAWLESADSTVTASASPAISSYLRQRRRWLSKGKAYTDSHTVLLAYVTFVTIILILSLLVAGFWDPMFFVAFLGVLLVKSIPDFLILRNTSIRYGKSNLMIWFLPAQIVYPFYVFGVAIYSFFSKCDNSNSPFPKEI